MKFYYKILNILLAVLIFIPSAFAIEESLEDILKEINEVRQEIYQLQSSNIKEAIIVDKALQELDQVMKFVSRSVENGDIKGAINTLIFIERSLSAVASIVPKEFKSEKVKEDLKEFSEKDMNEIMKITQGINKNKNRKTKMLINSMLASKMKGMDTFKISENLTDLGIKTIDKKEIKKVLTASTGTAKSSSIGRELEDQKRFGFIIGNSPEEVDLAIRQIEVIRSADPKKERAFDIEKYGLAAGIDKNTIARGVEAVYSGNINLEKKITFEILSKLSSNPSYEVTMPTMQEMDNMMNEAIAAEQAVYAVLNSGVDFGAGTKGSDVKKLAKEVESILSGTTDQETINRVVYSIERTEYGIWRSPEHFAAMVKAELSGGPNQTLALSKLNFQYEFGPSTQSLVETAAELEATLNDATESYIDAKYTDLADRLDLKELTSSQQNELSKVYSAAIESYSEKRAIAEVQSITKELQRTSAAASAATQKAAALSAEIAPLKEAADLANNKADEANKKIREMVQQGENVSPQALREANQLTNLAGMANAQIAGVMGKAATADAAATAAQDAADSAKQSAASIGITEETISNISKLSTDAVVASVQSAKTSIDSDAVKEAKANLAKAQADLENIYEEGRKTQSPMLTDISVQMQEIVAAKQDLQKAVEAPQAAAKAAKAAAAAAAQQAVSEAATQASSQAAQAAKSAAAEAAKAVTEATQAAKAAASDAAKTAAAEVKVAAAEAAKVAASEAVEAAKVAASEAAEAAKEVAKTEAIGAAESALAEAQSELEAIYAEGRRTQSTMLNEINVQMQKIVGAKNEVKKAKGQ